MANTDCARCQIQIDCRADDISQCHCSKVVLSKKLKTFLSKTSYDCLCNLCMHDLHELTDKAAQSNPWSIDMLLKEDLHFYYENGTMVFTEFYHILRGQCCKSGCRHCAYGK